MYGIGKVKIKFVPKKKRGYIGGIIFFSGVAFLIFSAMWSFPGVRHGVLVPAFQQASGLFQSVREVALNRILDEKTDLDIDSVVLPADGDGGGDSSNNLIHRVSGRSLEDLLRGQGYTHAKHRLFQMDVLGRRIAMGTAAEVLGADALHSDKTMHTFNISGIVEEEYAEMLRAHEQQGGGTRDRPSSASPTAYDYLRWYTKGVNQYIATHPALSLEYTLHGLHHPFNNRDTSPLSIAYWSVKDSLALLRLRLLFGADFLALQDALMRDVLGEVLQRDAAPGGDNLEGETGGSVFDELFGGAACGVDSEQEPESDVECIPVIGSSAWVAGGSYGADSFEKSVVPSRFLHMRLEIKGQQGWGVTGLTIPGIPFVVTNADNAESKLVWSTHISDPLGLVVGDTEGEETVEDLGANVNEPISRSATVRVRGEQDFHLHIGEHGVGPKSNLAVGVQPVFLSTLLALSNNVIGLDHAVAMLRRRFGGAAAAVEGDSCPNGSGATECPAVSVDEKINVHYSLALRRRQSAVSGTDLLLFLAGTNLATTLSDCQEAGALLPQDRLVLFCTDAAGQSAVFRGPEEVKASFVVAADFGFNRLAGQRLVAMLRTQNGAANSSALLEDVYSPAAARLAEFVTQVLASGDDFGGSGGVCEGLPVEHRSLLGHLLGPGSASAQFGLDSDGALLLEKLRGEVYSAVLSALFARNDNIALQAHLRSAEQADLPFEQKSAIGQIYDVSAACFNWFTAALNVLRDRVLAGRSVVIALVRGQEAADRADLIAGRSHDDIGSYSTRVPATTYMMMSFLDQQHHERLTLYADWYISLLLPAAGAEKEETMSLRSSITGQILGPEEKTQLVCRSLKVAVADLVQILEGGGEHSRLFVALGSGAGAVRDEAVVDALVSKHWTWKLHHVLRMPSSFMVSARPNYCISLFSCQVQTAYFYLCWVTCVLLLL